MTKLTSAELNSDFLGVLGGHVLNADGIELPVLLLELAPPLPKFVRAYLFNATNPEGGRPSPEHKIQLYVPGQGRGGRGNFDTSGDRAVIVAGKVEDSDEYVFWDASLYKDFAAYANVQVRTATIEAARSNGAIITQNRKLKLGSETVIVSPAGLVIEALAQRFTVGNGEADVGDAGHPGGGKPYAAPPRNVPAEPAKRVFEFDPSDIDRGTTAHKDVQDALAMEVESRGLAPLSPSVDDAQFDVAWMHQGVAYIAEVKSLTDQNEERQLRLGLGQVLSYVHLTEWPDAQAVRGVLAVERAPSADYWNALCADHDVVLTWPGTFGDLFTEGI